MLKDEGHNIFFMLKDNFCYFSSKQYVVTPHLNHLVKMVQMRGHNILVMPKKQKLSLIIPRYSLLCSGSSVIVEEGCIVEIYTDQTVQVHKWV